MQEKIFTLKMNGYCCSQIIMEIGLELMERENPELVEAMAGLCDGAKCGRICGVVSAANCLMYLADAKNAESEFIPEYLEWFEESFGGLDCNELLGDDPMAKMEKCPMFVEGTLTKLCELLELD